MPLSDDQKDQLAALFRTVGINAQITEARGEVFISSGKPDLEQRFRQLQTNLANDGSDNTPTVAALSAVTAALSHAIRWGVDTDKDGKPDQATSLEFKKEDVDALFTKIKTGYFSSSTGIALATDALNESAKTQKDLAKSTDKDDATIVKTESQLEDLLKKAGATVVSSHYENPTFGRAFYKVTLGNDNPQQVLTNLSNALKSEAKFKDYADLFDAKDLDKSNSFTITASSIDSKIDDIHYRFSNLSNFNGMAPAAEPQSVLGTLQDGVSKLLHGNTPSIPKLSMPSLSDVAKQGKDLVLGAQQPMKITGAREIRPLSPEEVNEVGQIKTLVKTIQSLNKNPDAGFFSKNYLSEGIESAMNSVKDALANNAVNLPNANPELSVVQTTFNPGELPALLQSMHQLATLTTALRADGKLTFVDIDAVKIGHSNDLNSQENSALKSVSDVFDATRGVALGEKVRNDFLDFSSNLKNPIAKRVEALAGLFYNDAENQVQQIKDQKLTTADANAQVELLERKAVLFKEIADRADLGDRSFGLSNPGAYHNYRNNNYNEKVALSGQDVSIIGTLDSYMNFINQADSPDKLDKIVNSLNQHYPSLKEHHNEITAVTPTLQQQVDSLRAALAETQHKPLDSLSILPTSLGNDIVRSV